MKINIPAHIVSQASSDATIVTDILSRPTGTGTIHDNTASPVSNSTRQESHWPVKNYFIFII